MNNDDEAMNQEGIDQHTAAHVAAPNGEPKRSRKRKHDDEAENQEGIDQQTSAHVAAQNGDERCLRVLLELGAGASLSAENASKIGRAHV